jgi:hypothetical protein
MAEQPANAPNPRSCLEALREALNRPELDEFDRPGPLTATARQAAYQLAVALGRCRLFGVQPNEELEKPLPANRALQAALELHGYLKAWTEHAHQLGRRWDESEVATVAEDLCLNLLEHRLEAWAVYLVIDDAYQACLESADPGREALGAAVVSVLDAAQAFDMELHAQRELLSVAAETMLLDTWRGLLAPLYREALPWWLDDTLEKVHRRLEVVALASQPRAGDVLHYPDWLPPVPRLAAAGEAEGPPTRPPLRWASPDGDFRARLALPARPRPDDTVLSLSFRSADDRPALLLHGQPVFFASVEGTIDADGKARFRLGQLRAARAGPVLEVGSERTRWLPETQPPSRTAEEHP